MSWGLKGDLRSLYQSYGGRNALLSSAYLWISAAITFSLSDFASGGAWANYALTVMPTLAGFSIAAFAIFFAVLDPKSQEALKKPEPTLDGRSPLLVLASAVIHAVVVQLAAILFALVYIGGPLQFLERILATLGTCYDATTAFSLLAAYGSLLGLFFLVYGILLVLAAALSIFRLIAIRASI